MDIHAVHPLHSPNADILAQLAPSSQRAHVPPLAANYEVHGQQFGCIGCTWSRIKTGSILAHANMVNAGAYVKTVRQVALLIVTDGVGRDFGSVRNNSGDEFRDWPNEHVMTPMTRRP
jgi:hypothetical protein